MAKDVVTLQARNYGKMTVKKLLVAIAAGAMLTACAWTPSQGDLVFVVASGGNMSQAIVRATATADSLQFDHVAVFAGTRRHPYVVEAAPREGVVRTEWKAFKSSARNGLVVKRLTVDYPKKEAIVRAESRLGQPYDWAYRPDNGKTYCSELVEESFVDASGARIFPAKPMRFRAADGTMPQFWIDTFNRLGEPIPEGVPGTNPNDMAHFPMLRTVRIVR